MNTFDGYSIRDMMAVKVLVENLAYTDLRHLIDTIPVFRAASDIYESSEEQYTVKELLMLGCVIGMNTWNNMITMFSYQTIPSDTSKPWVADHNLTYIDEYRREE